MSERLSECRQNQCKEILPSVGLSGSKSVGRKRRTEIATCVKQVVSTPEFQVDLVRLLCNIVYRRKWVCLEGKPLEEFYIRAHWNWHANKNEGI